jgi:hypothetical protein
VTPQDVARDPGAVRDEDLPMLAAGWLAEGHDSGELRALAGLTRRDAAEARALLPAVLASLGHAESDAHPVVRWACAEMDGRLTPYAAAQKVAEVTELDPGGPAAELAALLRRHDVEPTAEVDDLLRAAVRRAAGHAD